jgi:hypothetical protein
MEQKDKDDLKKELVEEFILIKKGRLYFLIGGATAVVVLALGIGIKATLDYIGTKQVEQTKERIAAILTEAETYRDQMLAGIPHGAIMAWNGKGTLPPGWAICDGKAGTPDLKDRFILGAVDQAAVGKVGGDKGHTHNASFTGSRFEADNIGARGTGATRHDDNRIIIAPTESLPPFTTLIYVMRL